MCIDQGSPLPLHNDVGCNSTIVIDITTYLIYGKYQQNSPTKIYNDNRRLPRCSREVHQCLQIIGMLTQGYWAAIWYGTTFHVPYQHKFIVTTRINIQDGLDVNEGFKTDIQ